MPDDGISSLVEALGAAIAAEQDRLEEVERQQSATAEQRVDLARAASRSQRLGAAGRGVASRAHQAEIARSEQLRQRFAATREALQAAAADLESLRTRPPEQG
jgi:hypothetical protein